jgi:hypothetical protein
MSQKINLLIKEKYQNFIKIKSMVLLKIGYLIKFYYEPDLFGF